MSKTLNSAGALQEVSWASWRRWHSSSGSSLSRFVLFLHLSFQDDDDDDQISVWSNQKYHWIITINVWKYNTTQQKMNWIESFVLVGTRGSPAGHTWCFWLGLWVNVSALFPSLLFPGSWCIQWEAFALVTMRLESLVSSAPAAASSAFISLEPFSLLTIFNLYFNIMVF